MITELQCKGLIAVECQRADVRGQGWECISENVRTHSSSEKANVPGMQGAREVALHEANEGQEGIGGWAKYLGLFHQFSGESQIVLRELVLGGDIIRVAS